MPASKITRRSMNNTAPAPRMVLGGPGPESQEESQRLSMIIPAATVVLVASSMRMNPPVARLRL
jgi:hypothetical protein